MTDFIVIKRLQWWSIRDSWHGTRALQLSFKRLGFVSNHRDRVMSPTKGKEIGYISISTRYKFFLLFFSNVKFQKEKKNRAIDFHASTCGTRKHFNTKSWYMIANRLHKNQALYFKIEVGILVQVYAWSLAKDRTDSKSDEAILK